MSLPLISLEDMEALLERYGFDQIIVLARKLGEDGYENLGTHGTDMEHSNAAAAIGEHLRKEVMGWVESPEGKELVGERVRLARAAPELERQRDEARAGNAVMVKALREITELRGLTTAGRARKIARNALGNSYRAEGGGDG